MEPDVIDLTTPPPQPDSTWREAEPHEHDAGTALLGQQLLEMEIDDGASTTDSPFKSNSAATAGLGKSGTFSSVVNLANTVVGAGMLGLPHAFAECGSGVAILLLIFSAMGSAMGLHLLAVSQATVGVTPSSFYTVANAALPSLTVLIDVAVALKCEFLCQLAAHAQRFLTSDV